MDEPTRLVGRFGYDVIIRPSTLRSPIRDDVGLSNAADAG